MATILARVKDKVKSETRKSSLLLRSWLGEIAPNIQREVDAKIEYSQRVLYRGQMPTDFSMTLGAAPCNHACLFCPQSVEKPDRGYWLDLDILSKVLSELPREGVRLNISSYTETLASPNLVPAVRLMKRIRPKLPVIMATNGTLFPEDKIIELIDLGLDYYSYSFDAATPQDYHVLMQKDDFKRVWENLERLVELRNQKKSPMRISTHIMHFKGVEEDFERFKSYWEKKVDTVVLRRVGNWGSDDLGLMKRLAVNGFVPAHQTPAERFPCTSIFMSFKLQYTGEYYPCVAAVPAYNKHEVPPLGSAKDITWDEAWERLGAMRRAHLESRWDDYACCRTCNIWSMWDNMWFQDVRLDGTKTPFYLKGVGYKH